MYVKNVSSPPKWGLNPYVVPGLRKKVDTTLIVKAVSDAFDITPKDLKSKSRKTAIRFARQVAMYIAYDCGHTLHECGKMVNRDHSTALYAYRKISATLSIKSESEYYKNLKNRIIEVVKLCNGESI